MSGSDALVIKKYYGGITKFNVCVDFGGLL